MSVLSTGMFDLMRDSDLKSDANFLFINLVKFVTYINKYVRFCAPCFGVAM